MLSTPVCRCRVYDYAPSLRFLSKASLVLRAAATQIHRPFPACSKPALKRFLTLFGLQLFRLFYPFIITGQPPPFPCKTFFFPLSKESERPKLFRAPLGQWTNPCSEAEAISSILCLYRCFLRRFPVSRHTVFLRTSGAVRRLYRASYPPVLSRGRQVGD